MSIYLRPKAIDSPIMAKGRSRGRGMGLFLIATGIGHFIVGDFLDSMVPAILPFTPTFWTVLSGIIEIAIGLSLFVPRNKRLFGWPIKLLGAYSALALFIAVYPANINMAITWADQPMPDPLIGWGRLPLQFLLFWWSWRLIKGIKREN